jgi:DNA-dependent RNA polymerase auxiliary subunit epsilon
MQYSFYVQPDFSTGVDFAAITIRELLSESNYNVTLISLTKDPLLMPPLLDIES